MDSQKYKSALLNAIFNKYLWMLISLFLVVSNTLLSYFVITANTSEKTIVVPPSLDKAFWVEGNKVSPDYLEQMAKYFSQLLLTYHKENIAAQHDMVLRYTDSSVYGALRANLATDAERVVRNDMSSVFYQKGAHIKKNTVYIDGVLLGMMGKKVVSRVNKTYKIEFEYRNGSLNVISFSEVLKSLRDDGYIDVVEEEDIRVENPNSSVGLGGVE